MATALARRRRTAIGATLAFVLLAGAATAAATGVFGDIPDEPGETVIAGGTTPVAGPWRVSTYTQRETGEPCLRIMLTEAVTPIMGGGWCGDGHLEFSASAIPVTLLDGRTEVLLYGVAPETAQAVELTARDGTRLRSRTHRMSPEGRPWVIAAPLALEGGSVTWLDESGRQGTDPQEVSGAFSLTERQQRIVARSG